MSSICYFSQKLFVIVIFAVSLFCSVGIGKEKVDTNKNNLDSRQHLEKNQAAAIGVLVSKLNEGLIMNEAMNEYVRQLILQKNKTASGAIIKSISKTENNSLSLEIKSIVNLCAWKKAETKMLIISQNSETGEIIDKQIVTSVGTTVKNNWSELVIPNATKLSKGSYEIVYLLLAREMPNGKFRLLDTKVNNITITKNRK